MTRLSGITLGRNTTNASLRELAHLNLPDEFNCVQFQSSQINDLAPLKELANLPSMFVNTTSLTDQGLQALPEIRGLERLFILEEGPSANLSRFGELGFRAIGSMPELKYLSLARLEITSDSAAHLHRLKNLRELGIHRCLIDAKDVAALRAALPDCKVSYSERSTP